MLRTKSAKDPANVLHVVAPADGGDGSLAWCKSVWSTLHTARCTQRAVVVGGSDERHLAQSSWVGGVGVPEASASTGATAWVLPLGSGVFRRAESATVVAWSVQAMLAASAPLGRRPVDFLVTDRAPPAWFSFLNRVALHRALVHATVCVPCEGLAARWRTRTARVEVASCDAAGTITQTIERENARRSLGILPGAVVVAMLADPSATGDARRFLHESGTVTESGHPVVGLMSRRVHGLGRAARYQEAFGRSWPLIAADGPMSALLRAADIAVFHPDSLLDGGLAMARCALEYGLPVVTPRCDASVEVLGDLPSMAHQADYLSMSRALRLLVANPAARREAAMASIESAGRSRTRNGVGNIVLRGRTQARRSDESQPSLAEGSRVG